MMKSGILGLPGAGKSVIFTALTGKSVGEHRRKGEDLLGTIRVPDERVDVLSGIYNPKKTIYAQVEYLLPGNKAQSKEAKKDPETWTRVRDCEAIIHVIRNYGGYGLGPPTPRKDFDGLNQELILADLVVVEKRLERLSLDKKRGKKINPEEFSLLEACLESLNNETPLRKQPELASANSLKGYAFLSAKPMLVLFNNEDEDDGLPAADELLSTENCISIRGKLEAELIQMTREEAQDFLDEFNISESAMDRVIQSSYRMLGLISFFTVGDDEVRAWTIKNGAAALEAAGTIHTDFEKGFIRAEVLSFADFMAAGGFQPAKKNGRVRLEGKTYPVQDGDIISFRFNV
jgi:GTP-binding protein YchF